jgi:zinc/manganese transport system ATP-binding protein/zinc transport system ATP-binding protein
MSSHAIELTHVTAAYDGAPVLRDVSLRIPAGQFAGLIGPSGAGKTTLLRTMLGLAPHVQGTVQVAGQTVLPDRPPAGVGYVPQVGTNDWTFPVSVENVIMMGIGGSARRLPWASREEKRQIGATLERLGLNGLGGRHIRDLSGGQQQRVFLARALAGNPRILILDEPTASVDVKTRDDVLHLLAELNRAGTTIVMTTHELNGLAAHLPWVVCVNGGIVAQGSPAAVFDDQIMSRTFGAEMRVLTDERTGARLVAEAGSHRPFSLEPSEPPALAGAA